MCCSASLGSDFEVIGICSFARIKIKSELLIQRWEIATNLFVQVFPDWCCSFSTHTCTCSDAQPSRISASLAGWQQGSNQRKWNACRIIRMYLEAGHLNKSVAFFLPCKVYVFDSFSFILSNTYESSGQKEKIGVSIKTVFGHAWRCIRFLHIRRYSWFCCQCFNRER